MVGASAVTAIVFENGHETEPSLLTNWTERKTVPSKGGMTIVTAASVAESSAVLSISPDGKPVTRPKAPLMLEPKKCTCTRQNSKPVATRVGTENGGADGDGSGDAEGVGDMVGKGKVEVEGEGECEGESMGVVEGGNGGVASASTSAVVSARL